MKSEFADKQIETLPGVKSTRTRVSAETMSQMQRDISISEFFSKNRHLLGFDNASRALLTSIKEAVDNSLDACEEAGILPDVKVVIEQLTETRYRMTVEDNGPGIVKAQVPKVFGKLLYGSKFHRLRQSRGQQGIGISAAGMYGQLTTGKPVVVTSKTGKGKPAYYCELRIDTKKNIPVIDNEKTVDWTGKDHGTSVAIEMEASYKGGKKGVDEFIQQVAFANPHLRLEYWRPSKPPLVYPRVTEELPPEAKEIKPHPYGVELGMLMRLMQGSSEGSISSLLQTEFSRVTSSVSQEILSKAKVSSRAKPKDITQTQAEAIYKAIADTKIMAPPTNCLAPIGEAALIEGLKALLVQQHFAAEEARQRKRAEDEAAAAQAALEAGGDATAQAAAAVEAKLKEALEKITEVAPDEDELEDGEREKYSLTAPADSDVPFMRAGVIDVFGHPCFVTSVTRPPKVYRGNPFQVEAAIAWGGEMPGDELAQVVRFANRVPLLYQQGACAMTQSVLRTNWKSYDVEQSRGALPTGPLLVMVHIASVWVPFTSEAKEAVAHYDEIINELKAALQECGRRLSRHIRRKRRVADELKKANYISKYIPHIGEALQQILGLSNPQKADVIESLTGVLERSRHL
ncbi:MAG: DNA topoisomerase VI subunit B [Clostridia bacterium]|nr:DNA topoisomerase VI subunit B [Deltaproteobacteria bacterium]